MLTITTIASPLPVRRIGVAACLVSVLLLSGCAGETSAKATGAGPGGPGKLPPRPVQLIPARQQSVARTVSVNGTLAAEDQVVLGMKVAGRISELLVDLGSTVRKGQIVARIEPTDLQLAIQQSQAALQQARTRLGLPIDGEAERVNPAQTALVRQAQASLTEARLNRERAQQLFEQKLIARSELEASVAAFQLAEGRYQDAVEEIRNRQAVLTQRKTELALARQALADSVLRSPIDGAVLERQGSVGQFIQAAAPIVTIVQISPLRLRLPVPERAAAGIRVGQTVRVVLDDRQTTATGRVARLAPAIEEANRTLLVEAEVPNPTGRLRPGTFARAEIVVESGEPSIFVPATSLVTFAGLEKVITVENGKAAEKIVRTGRREGTLVEITEGLKPGESVVARPGNLVGGQPVIVR